MAKHARRETDGTHCAYTKKHLAKLSMKKSMRDTQGYAWYKWNYVLILTIIGSTNNIIHAVDGWSDYILIRVTHFGYLY